MVANMTQRKLYAGMLVVLLTIVLPLSLVESHSAYAAQTNTGQFLTSGSMNAQSVNSSSYRILYKANGGKGAMKAQIVKRNKKTALAANGFSRAGCKFAGWNTKKNGKGKSYKNKQKVKNLAKAGKTITLYAQWKKNSKASLNKLSIGKACSKYDLTGNGKKDKLLLKAITDVDHPEIYYYLEIYLNGKKIETLVLRQTVPEAKLAVLGSGQVLLYVRGTTTNGYYSWGALFKCKFNELMRVADTSDIARRYSSSHSGAWRTYETLSSVKGNDLYFTAGSSTTGSTTYVYRYKDGKLIER